MSPRVTEVVVTTEAPGNHAALEYERKERRPPYLDAGPGRVVLVMPPPPRWLAVVVVTLVVLLWVVILGLTVGAAVIWWRVPGVPPQVRWATAFLGVGAVVLGLAAYESMVWIRRNEPFHIEVADGMLTYNWPGAFGRLRTHRLPLAKVKRVTAREHALGPRVTTVDVRISLRPLGTIRRVFRSPHPGFATEVELAFADALARRGSQSEEAVARDGTKRIRGSPPSSANPSC